ncbi:MAG TPA: PIN domain-containing protein [Opitutales bacterium]|nr:PIN domain-containing protein [Opitutales bacterium]
MAKASFVGVDTPLIVAHGLADHPDHEAAKSLVEEVLDAGQLLALCPIIVDEFIHVVTDPRRFERPLPMNEALRLAEGWCQSRETQMLYPTEASVQLQLVWMREHRLGRKRLHDTHIAAIYHLAGVSTILTSNARDFSVFAGLKLRLLDSGKN